MSQVSSSLYLYYHLILWYNILNIVEIFIISKCKYHTDKMCFFYTLIGWLEVISKCYSLLSSWRDKISPLTFYFLTVLGYCNWKKQIFLVLSVIYQNNYLPKCQCKWRVFTLPRCGLVNICHYSPQLWWIIDNYYYLSHCFYHHHHHYHHSYHYCCCCGWNLQNFFI